MSKHTPRRSHAGRFRHPPSLEVRKLVAAQESEFVLSKVFYYNRDGLAIRTRSWALNTTTIMQRFRGAPQMKNYLFSPPRTFRVRDRMTESEQSYYTTTKWDNLSCFLYPPVEFTQDFQRSEFWIRKHHVYWNLHDFEESVAVRLRTHRGGDFHGRVSSRPGSGEPIFRFRFHIDSLPADPGLFRDDIKGPLNPVPDWKRHDRDLVRSHKHFFSRLVSYSREHATIRPIQFPSTFSIPCQAFIVVRRLERKIHRQLRAKESSFSFSVEVDLHPQVWRMLYAVFLNPKDPAFLPEVTRDPCEIRYLGKRPMNSSTETLLWDQGPLPPLATKLWWLDEAFEYTGMLERFQITSLKLKYVFPTETLEAKCGYFAFLCNASQTWSLVNKKRPRKQRKKRKRKNTRAGASMDDIDLAGLDG